MSQMIERITKIETTLADNNDTIHKIEQALFGNGKPGLLSDFRILAKSVNDHHAEAAARLEAEAKRREAEAKKLEAEAKKRETEKQQKKLDWQWIITTLVAVAAILAVFIK